MPPQQQQFSRISLADLKAQILKRIGPERAEKYFGHLSKLLSHKLSKHEFDSLCYKTIGSDNISLHNHFIQAIFKNAVHAKVPPPLQDSSKPIRGIKRKSVTDDGSLQNSSLSPHGTGTWVNGDAGLLSKKNRSRDRRARDRPSPLGPHGRPDPSGSAVVNNDASTKCLENGDSSICDLHRPVQSVSSNAEQSDGDGCATVLPSLKRQKINRVYTPQEPVSLDSKATPGYGEDGDEVELLEHELSTRIRSPLKAPLGVPFCPGSVGGARKESYTSSVNYLSLASHNQEAGCCGNDFLPDTRSIHKHMEQIAASEGLQSVSLEAANVLNNGLDAYLKGIIKSCIELRASSHSHESERQVQVPNKQGLGRLAQGLNGYWPVQSMQLQNTGNFVEAPPRTKSGGVTHISYQDFKFAMELNPQQLGEDWPLQLEKISSNSFLSSEIK